jgi:hypothetical protein
MSGYYRRGGYQRRSYPQTVGRIARANQRPGPCRECGAEIPAGGGQLYREESGTWSVVHLAATWAGSPVSGQWAGGCPAETDRLNTAGGFGGTAGPVPEGDRLAVAAAASQRVSRGRYDGGKYAYTGTGARMTMSSRRCEDAPCCGCCD